MKIFNLLIGAFMSISIACSSQAKDGLITHDKNNLFDITTYQKRLEAKTNLTLPLAEEQDLLTQLSAFELGRFLLINKGLDGEHTSYVILHDPKKSNLSPLEKWLLTKAPVVQATQERFQIFKNQLQKYLGNNMTIASIPCGLMDDLLGLEFKETQNVNFVGVDLDEKSLQLAKDNAKHHSITNVTFLRENAWQLSASSQYDIITSNGLNIYEHDDSKVVELYKEFYKALKPKGILITSFLTPPPALSKESTWREYDAKDLLKQKAIFGDIIGAQWQAYRTEELTHRQLEEAGFRILKVIYDRQGMFPTIIVQKG